MPRSKQTASPSVADASHPAAASAMATYATMEPALAVPCPATRPRSATLVGVVEWAWSPSHNRMDTYHLSTNRPRSHWILWKSTFDEIAVEDGPAQPYAYCPGTGFDAKAAAQALLLVAWQGESAEWVEMAGEPMEPFHRVSRPGLLDRREWSALRRRAWPHP